MKKILRFLSVTILILTFLCLFAASIRHVTKGKNRLGFLTKPLIHFSTFPSTVKDVLTSKEIKGIPLIYTLADSTLETINHLDYDLFGHNSFYNAEKKRWDIRLFNFRNDSVIFSWYLEKASFFKTGERRFENGRPKNPILLPDRSLIVLCAETNNMYRLDRNSNIIWHNTDKNFHHSLNMSADGSIWTCTSDDRAFTLGNHGKRMSFRDDFVTEVNPETGQILFDKSVSDMLIENHYGYLVYGFSNDGEPSSEIEPIHLNDVEPVLESGPFWKKGDLFLSFRHRSMVIQYRPETDRIIRFLQGPFLHQHDVDIISDHEIAIFDNNTTNIGLKISEEEHSDSMIDSQDNLNHSGIVIYNFNDSVYKPYSPELFIEEDIYSRTEGLYHFLSSGDVFVENQNDATLYIISNDSILLKKQFETTMDNFVHLPNWIRIYENINF